MSGLVGPTQKDVAERAKVSRALVSMVMRDAPHVSEGSRRRVLQAARELGYRPNALAQGLASKRVNTLGVLVNDVTNPYFGALYASLAGAASRAGYDILTAPGTRTPGSEMALVNTLLDHRVGGLALLSPLMKVADLRRVAALRPTVVVGREVSISCVDVVTTDEEAAATMVVDRLAALGHRHIAHISGGRNRPARDRATGYLKAMANLGLPAVQVAGAFTEAGGRAGAQALLAVRPRITAVIAANDLAAVGALGVFRSAGLRVPDDLSVVGYDDSQIAQLDLVQLSSVRQSIHDFGTTAVAVLTARIEDPDLPRTVLRLGTTLVERLTMGPAPRSRHAPWTMVPMPTRSR